MKNSPNSLKIHDNNENCHDSGFHGIESRLLRRIDDSDDTDSLGKQKSMILYYLHPSFVNSRTLGRKKLILQKISIFGRLKVS